MRRERSVHRRIVSCLLLCHSAVVTAKNLSDQFVAAAPAGQVNIYRDEWDVPHIVAAREEDGFYGLGYATSEDQPERFYLEVLRARGELAAEVSPSELSTPLNHSYPDLQSMIESDYHAKLWGVDRFATRAVAKLDSQLRINYQAYLHGVRDYARDHPAQVPPWRPRDVSIADVVAVIHSGLWDAYQGGVAVDDCTRGGAPMGSPSAPAYSVGYSNEWALAPRRTADREAVLLSDPHGGMDGRFTHEFTFQAGSLHTAGFALGPVMILGRNERIGWGLTTGAPDVADCYVVKTVTEDAGSYLFDGQVSQVERETLNIAVKDHAAITVIAKYVTVNGIRSPVIAEMPRTLFVAVTPYLHNLEGLHNTVYRMNKARTTEEYLSAVATGGMFPQNLLAVDTRGEMIYIHAGLVPIRSDASVDWTHPVPGNDSAFAWKGIHSVRDLIIIRTPRSGYIENNNTDPRFMDVRPPRETVGKPEYLLADGSMSTNSPSTRATLFLDLVSRKDTFNRAEIFALALDVENYKWNEWLAVLKHALESEPLVDDERAFAADLLSFAGELDSHSTSALKYVLWREALRELLDQADGESLAGTILRGAPLSPSIAVKATHALHAAAAKLAVMPRGNARTYGDTFRLDAGEESVPMSGGALRPSQPGAVAADCAASKLLCAETLLAVHFDSRDRDTRVAVSGTRILRLDFLSSRGIKSFDYENPGISDDENSPHSRDQAQRLVSRRTLKPILFNLQDLPGHVVSRETLATRDSNMR